MMDSRERILRQRLSAEYKQAEKELLKEFKEYTKAFENEDKEKRRLVRQGKLSPSEHIEWRKNKMLYKDTLKQKVDVMSQHLLNVNKQARGIIRRETFGVYADQYNFGVYQVEKGLHIDTSFMLFDQTTVKRMAEKNPKLLPERKAPDGKILKYSRRKVNTAITQGVLQGESIDDIAKRLTKVVGMEERYALTNARTAMTGAQNAGRLDSYIAMKKMGIKLRKQWMATLDERTRTSHQEMDGEIVDIEEKFSNELEYPGDPEGHPREVYNCRCTMIADLPDFPPENMQRLDNIDKTPIDYVTYKEWAQEKFRKQKIGTTQGVAVTNTGGSVGQVQQNNKPRTAQYINNITEVGLNNSPGAKRRVQTAIDSTAQALGVTSQQAKEALERGIQRIVDECDMVMRIRGSNLEKVLREGYFKNQFETGTSGGALGTGMRRLLEHEKFGVPKDGISDGDRPIYGMLAPKFSWNNDRIVKYYESGAGSWYGDVTVVLKKENLINNATMTLGDSLDYDMSIVGTEMNNIKYSGSYDMGTRTGTIARIDGKTPTEQVADAVIDFTGTGDGYFEYQIHGKENHSVDNIECVIIPYDAWTYYEGLRKELNRRGIRCISSRKVN